MKTVKIKSALPLYGSALVWILFGLLSPIYRWRYILLAAGVSAVIYALLSAVFPGRKVEREEAPNSGDSEIDRQILEGRRQLRSLRTANDAIEDALISARLDRMTKAGEGIFECLEKDTSKANDVRRFMNYYLPTAEKLLSSYQSLRGTGSKGENVTSALKSIENSLEMIAAAFEKQLDRLYADDQLDINAEISALETMMAADGLSGDLVMRQQTQK